jgi:hypothetical protein
VGDNSDAFPLDPRDHRFGQRWCGRQQRCVPERSDRDHGLGW